MVRNVRPEATLGENGTIELGDQVRPGTGSFAARRRTLDHGHPAGNGGAPARGHGRLPRLRSGIPQGIPFGIEREALDLAWSLGRRLYGAVVTDAGVRLEPHPFQVRDLTVVSPHALAPESASPSCSPRSSPTLSSTRCRRKAARTGYSATIPLPEGEEYLPCGWGSAPAPAALSALDWVEDAVDYQLVHLTADPEEDAIEVPSTETAERWQLAYQRIGLIAGLLTESVGGYIVDLEGLPRRSHRPHLSAASEPRPPAGSGGDRGAAGGAETDRHEGDQAHGHHQHDAEDPGAGLSEIATVAAKAAVPRKPSARPVVA